MEKEKNIIIIRKIEIWRWIFIWWKKWKGKGYIKGKLEYEGEYLFVKNGMEKDIMKMVI